MTGMFCPKVVLYFDFVEPSDPAEFSLKPRCKDV